MSCCETNFNSFGVWQHAFFHLQLMMVHFKTHVSINRFFKNLREYKSVLYLQFLKYFAALVVYSSLCDLCAIKILIFSKK